MWEASNAGVFVKCAGICSQARKRFGRVVFRAAVATSGKQSSTVGGASFARYRAHATFSLVDLCRGDGGHASGFAKAGGGSGQSNSFYVSDSKGALQVGQDYTHGWLDGRTLELGGDRCHL